jgi:hypothetical protein
MNLAQIEPLNVTIAEAAALLGAVSGWHIG